MKFINLRRPGSKPVFVVLPSENKKYTFYINNVKVRLFVFLVAIFWSMLSAVCPQRSLIQVNLKKGTITVPPGEPEAVQHIR